MPKLRHYFRFQKKVFGLITRKYPLRCLNCNATPSPSAAAADAATHAAHADYKSGHRHRLSNAVPQTPYLLRMSAECVVIVEEAENEEGEEERSVAVDSTSTAVGSADSEDENNSGKGNFLPAMQEASGVQLTCMVLVDISASMGKKLQPSAI